MLEPFESPIQRRVAVFVFDSGHRVANLMAPYDDERREEVQQLPGFSHWGSDPVLIDIIPYPTLGEAA